MSSGVLYREVPLYTVCMQYIQYLIKWKFRKASTIAMQWEHAVYILSLSLLYTLSVSLSLTHTHTGLRLGKPGGVPTGGASKTSFQPTHTILAASNISIHNLEMFVGSCTRPHRRKMFWWNSILVCWSGSVIPMHPVSKTIDQSCMHRPVYTGLNQSLVDHQRATHCCKIVGM